MPAGFTVNPQLQTNAAGSFSTTIEGYVQGTALNDPAVRNHLAAGVVGPTVTNPMWGGEGITDSAPVAGTEASSVFSVLTLATSQANLTGFTVFDQAHSMVNSPQSPVPLAGQTMGLSFYRFGSGARICVACSSGVASALAGAASNVLLYWDYTNQVLLNAPGGTAIAAKLIAVDAVGNSMTVSFSSGTGFATWNRTGFSAVIEI